MAELHGCLLDQASLSTSPLGNELITLLTDSGLLPLLTFNLPSYSERLVKEFFSNMVEVDGSSHTLAGNIRGVDLVMNPSTVMTAFSGLSSKGAILSNISSEVKAAGWLKMRGNAPIEFSHNRLKNKFKPLHYALATVLDRCIIIKTGARDKITEAQLALMEAVVEHCPLNWAAIVVEFVKVSVLKFKRNVSMGKKSFLSHHFVINAFLLQFKGVSGSVGSAELVLVSQKKKYGKSEIMRAVEVSRFGKSSHDPIIQSRRLRRFGKCVKRSNCVYEEESSDVSEEDSAGYVSEEDSVEEEESSDVFEEESSDVSEEDSAGQSPDLHPPLKKLKFDPNIDVSKDLNVVFSGLGYHQGRRDCDIGTQIPSNPSNSETAHRADASTSVELITPVMAAGTQAGSTLNRPPDHFFAKDRTVDRPVDHFSTKDRTLDRPVDHFSAKDPVLDRPADHLSAKDPTLDRPADHFSAKDPTLDRPADHFSAKYPTLDRPADHFSAKYPTLGCPADHFSAKYPTLDRPANHFSAKDPTLDCPADHFSAKDPTLDGPADHFLAKDPLHSINSRTHSEGVQTDFTDSALPNPAQGIAAKSTDSDEEILVDSVSTSPANFLSAKKWSEQNIIRQAIRQPTGKRIVFRDDDFEDNSQPKHLPPSFHYTAPTPPIASGPSVNATGQEDIHGSITELKLNQLRLESSVAALSITIQDLHQQFLSFTHQLPSVLRNLTTEHREVVSQGTSGDPSQLKMETQEVKAHTQAAKLTTVKEERKNRLGSLSTYPVDISSSSDESLE